MAALVSNLRRSGVLFYKDRAGRRLWPTPTPRGGRAPVPVWRPVRRTGGI